MISMAGTCGHEKLLKACIGLAHVSAAPCKSMDIIFVLS